MGRGVLGAALLVLGLAAPVAAQGERATHLALGGYLTAAFADVSITSYCHGQGWCHESNPLLAPIVERRGVVAAMTVKGAMHAGVAWWVLRDHRTHPRRAFWVAVGLTAAQVAVDVWNVRVTNRCASC